MIHQVASAIKGNTAAQIDANRQAKSQSVAIDRLAKATEELTDRVDRLSDKVVDAAAKLK